ncbi:hypothetical protein BABINDRAFT_165335 [Babjeviella inositovora NRRL Y-12698]|uniref:Large ribosomal subunit protein mL50 n=1 Tax=Babjeviella inositovora NRRL Y-12698 TaxID=984486 RepID=A0A1E3QVX1_9ASCO|nr:uncharacterized protein BABINDRAFT_165335 [Babjeviella inositovora NRRL Y-12698]ODQ81815.1 hypothetical protein BABINDRAFT_165335 [Babjeviella inositovora NRRL Y-12698]
MSVIRNTLRTNVAGSARSFSITNRSAALMDFLPFVNKSKTAEQPLPSEATSEEVKKEVLKNQKPKVLGAHVKDLSWKKKMNGFTVSPWIAAETQKQADQTKLPEEEIHQVLTTVYAEVTLAPAVSIEELLAVSLDDLTLRFQVTKKFQEATGFTLRDYQLTQVRNIQDLKNLYYTFVKLRNEKLPNAIYLESSDFANTNVYIDANVTDAVQAKKLKDLVKKAEKIAKDEFDQFVEKSKA